jgi:hypothetical protein
MSTKNTDYENNGSSVIDLFGRLPKETHTTPQSIPNPPSMPVKKRKIFHVEDHFQETQKIILKGRLLQNEVERLMLLIENQNLLPPKAYKHFNALEATKMVGLEEPLVGYLCKPQTVTSCLSMYIKTMEGYINKITSYRDAKIAHKSGLQHCYNHPLEYLHLINSWMISKRAEISLKENSAKNAARKRPARGQKAG